MIHSKILGVGSYLPEKILTNADLEKIVNTTDEWIVERTGISERRIAGEDETSATLGYKAASQALKKAEISANEIDMIIVATCTSDRFFPSTACLLQDKLSINRNIPAFDITAACSGFVYALVIAEQFIRGGIHKNILVVGTEVLSRGLDWTDRNTCVLFGDGAGAIILQASSEPGILSADLYAQGKYKEILSLPSFEILATENSQKQLLLPHLAMNGKEVFKLASKFVEEAIVETLAKNKLTHKDIDWIIPHQANERIMYAISKKLNISFDKFVSTIKYHGNTSAASIPLALDQFIDEGKIKPGHLILLEGFGGGMTWGSILIKY